MSARDAVGDAGAAALLTTAVGLLLALLVTVTLAAGAAATLDATRARSAADAAALAALTASPLHQATGGRDPGAPAPLAGAGDQPRGAPHAALVAAATRVLAAQGADLVLVDAGGWPVRVVVTASVPPTGPLSTVRGPVRARATAVLRPPPAPAGRLPSASPWPVPHAVGRSRAATIGPPDP